MRAARALRPLALAAALAAAPAAGEDFGTAARVNGAEISSERLARYFEEFLGERGRSPTAIRSPSAFKELKRQALDALIDQELLWQEARRRKLVAREREVAAAVARFEAQFPDERRRRLALERGGFTDEGYRAWVRQQLSVARLVEEEIAPRVRVTGAEVRAFYEANPALFSQPEAVRLRQILARWPPGAGQDGRDAVRGRLEPVLEAARGGADFAALARQYSEDASAAAGGDLGWLGRGEVAAPLEAAAFALKPGELSPLLETDEGLVILRLEARREAGRIPLAQARAAIRERLLGERRQEAVQARALELRRSGEVDILLPL